MKVGEIYYWNTDQAKGYATRPKYHLYVAEADWRLDGNHVFLFISSADYSGKDYALSKVDYPFFTKDISYVGSQSLVSYPAGYLAPLALTPKGVLSAKHCAELRGVVAESDLLEGWQIALICRALDGVR